MPEESKETSGHAGENEQVKKLGSHAAGSPDMFETRQTAEQTIEPPEEPSAGSTSAY